MLVLTRKSNQSIMIGDDIEVSVLSIMGEKVRIGIQAPRDIPVFRKEVYLEIQQENVAAGASARAEVDDALKRLSTNRSAERELSRAGSTACGTSRSSRRPRWRSASAASSEKRSEPWRCVRAAWRCERAAQRAAVGARAARGPLRSPRRRPLRSRRCSAASAWLGDISTASEPEARRVRPSLQTPHRRRP